MTEHWRDQWDRAADLELSHTGQQSVAELHRRLLAREFGEYHVIWNAIIDTHDLRAFGWPLFDFIGSSAEYLPRYHAARALLALLNRTDYEPVKLSAKHMHPEVPLAEVEELLKNAIGARGV